MRYLRLTPLDTLFFRDGSPFSAGETGQMEVRGLFPPNATTVVGALRAAFARRLGWARGAWPAHIIAKLGDGEALHPLSFAGPYLDREGHSLFPAPLHLLKGQGGERHAERAPASLALLGPKGEARETDIGRIRLLEPRDGSVSGLKPLEDAYLTLDAMQAVLAGEVPHPAGVIEANELWASEARIGIHRDDTTRTTKQNALYHATHVRLSPVVSLVMGVAGYDGEVPQLATMGGESRMVGLESVEDFPLPAGPPPLGRYTVSLLTPARFGDDGWRTPGGELPGLPGKIMAACVGKPLMIGGWDSEARAPKPLEPHLPPGSTWFMETERSSDLTAFHGRHIGENTRWGYGQILIGAWR